MIRSVIFEIPDSPRAVIQRSGRKTIVVIELEAAWELVMKLTEDLTNLSDVIRAEQAARGTGEQPSTRTA